VQPSFERVREHIFYSVPCAWNCTVLDFWPVTNRTLNIQQPVDIRSCSDRDACFWQYLYVFFRPSSRVLRGSTHAVQISCILVSNGHRRKFHNEKIYVLTSAYTCIRAITGVQVRKHSTGDRSKLLNGISVEIIEGKSSRRRSRRRRNNDIKYLLSMWGQTA